MDPALRLQPGQRELTPAQRAEAWRFAEECIRRQLSTEPVDERQAEAFLRQAYEVAGLPPPQRIHWLDGPLQLVAALAPPSVSDSVWTSVGELVKDSIRHTIKASVEFNVGEGVEGIVWELVGASVGASVEDSVRAYVEATWLAFYRFF